MPLLPYLCRMLYVVPTPVGNMEDMTMRAIRVLNEADLILAEDTRTSGVLLSRYDIHTPVISYHKYNEHESVNELVGRLEGGMKIALISDAGTPGISDPGFLLVREAVKRGVEVQTLPGATAFVPSLVSSGLPCNKFIFEGFLPQKKGRLSRIQLYKNEERTVIFYESPRRLQKTLEQFISEYGEERQICVSREISKIHESHVRVTLREVSDYFSQHEPLGEIVIILGPQVVSVPTGAGEENELIMGKGKSKNKYKN